MRPRNVCLSSLRSKRRVGVGQGRDAWPASTACAWITLRVTESRLHPSRIHPPPVRRKLDTCVLGVPQLETLKTTVVDDVLASESLRCLRDKILGATRRIFGPHWGTLIARPNLLVFGFLATAITVLVGLSWFQRNQVDEARSA